MICSNKIGNKMFFGFSVKKIVKLIKERNTGLVNIPLLFMLVILFLPFFIISGLISWFSEN
jgi:hypothetical protein